MLRGADPTPRFERDIGSYPFVEVQGDGVYEIPVGPVHAGLIEPGHFRFSVVGETILRMKARLWFVHRGVEKLFEGRTPLEGMELAERISGDTTVGHALAYALAVEEAAGLELDEQARVTRALLLELERLYNHVNDLGAIANDVGFSIAHAHTQRLRETLLRHNKSLTGHRLLRGGITIGGARLASMPDVALIHAVAAEVAEVVGITLDHPVVADRFSGTAVLHAEQAEHLGVLGYVARASGLAVDARVDHPFVHFDEPFAPAIEHSGDVRGRFVVRACEVAMSASLVTALTRRLGQRTVHAVGLAQEPTPGGAGVGVVEAWRGMLCHRVELDVDGCLSRVKVVDPSFFNWPALPVSLADTIVPDFPLANKSFNQSYAGNDL
jgi:Ni,Fe-hydrogenase III large subunit